MPDTTASQKTRLLMTRYTVDDAGTITLDSKVSFTVQLNPADLKHSRSISYSDTNAQGGINKSPKFSAVGADKVNFSLLLDGTGAVPMAAADRVDVKTQLENLTKVVYQYIGTQHEPGHVRLLWGTLIFFGRLESISTQYTLFKPSGDPLRAKVELAFMGSMSKTEAELESNLSSPDLTHSIEVREGDTLPLLCKRIYGEPDYYLDVARFNDLLDFRNLKPGVKLSFPPLS